MNLSVCPVCALALCVSSSDTLFMCNNNLEAIIALIKTSDLIKRNMAHLRFQFWVYLALKSLRLHSWKSALKGLISFVSLENPVPRDRASNWRVSAVVAAHHHFRVWNRAQQYHSRPVSKHQWSCGLSMCSWTVRLLHCHRHEGRKSNVENYLQFPVLQLAAWNLPLCLVQGEFSQTSSASQHAIKYEMT